MKIKLLLPFILLYFTSNSQIINLEWANHFGSSGQDVGKAVSVGQSGNVYLGGTFTGNTDFDPDSTIYNLSSGSVNIANIFISKYNASGNLIWAKKMATNTSDVLNEMYVDAHENIYITGYMAGTTDFDPSAATAYLTSHGQEDIYIAKYDSAGTYQWAINIGGNAQDGSWAIAVDTSGSVFTTGYFRNSADFDAGTDTLTLTSAGNTDAFIMKLNPDGTLAWAKQIGGIYNDNATDLALDGLGHINITGTFEGDVDFDPDTSNYSLTGPGIFFAQYDSSGNFIFAKSIPTYSYGNRCGIAVDPLNNIYVSTSFNGTVDFDPGTGIHNLSGYYDVFFSKYDMNGNYIWSKSITGSGWDWFDNIYIDSLANVYLTGAYSSTADFDPGSGTINLTPYYDDGFFAVYDSSGNYLYAFGIGGTSSVDGANAICSNNMGSIFITGRFSTTADFEPGGSVYNLTSNGNGDIYLAKYNPSLTGSKPMISELLFRYYPNPATNETLYMQSNGPLNNAGLIITNSLGQTVKKIAGLNGLINQLDLSKLKSGMYFIQIFQDGKIISAEKLIIGE